MRRFVVRSAFEVSNLHLCTRNSPSAGTSRVLRRHLRVSHIPKPPSVCASSVDPEATPESISLKLHTLQHILETRTSFFDHVAAIVWNVWLNLPKAPFLRVWLPSRRRSPVFPRKFISTSNAHGLDPAKFFLRNLDSSILSNVSIRSCTFLRNLFGLSPVLQRVDP